MYDSEKCNRYLFLKKRYIKIASQDALMKKCNDNSIVTFLSQTCAAEYLGHYLIHFSLNDKITCLLPTQARKWKLKRKRNEQQSHPCPTPTVKCTTVIHHKLNTSQLYFKQPPSLLTTESSISVWHHILHTTAMLTRDKHAASGCTHALVTAYLIFFLSA